tara:strand:+ start:838 stop:1410 length:573 start_codon:yes stop_codon:yes gene_type:complete
MSQLKVNSIIPVAGVPTGGGGGIIQVLTNTTRNSTGSVSLSSVRTYYDVPDQNVTITPTSSTSKILISFQQSGEFSSSAHSYNFALERSISGGATTTIQGDVGSDTSKSANFTQALYTYHADDNDTTFEIAHCSNYLDSPATTSAVTYKIKVRTHEGGSGTYYYNRTVLDNNANHSDRGLSWITVMEVSA